MKVRKAVIPAAGLGTRMLPATKTVPKEMLPMVDKPVIQYIIEEAVASGIEDILIVTNRAKSAMDDYFDYYPELETRLLQAGKERELVEVRRAADLANIFYVRQKETKGLGHAIYRAKRFVGDEPFAVLLGDDIMRAKKPVTLQLIEGAEKYGASAVGVQKVSTEAISRYSSVKISALEDRIFDVSDMNEKPTHVFQLRHPGPVCAYPPDLRHSGEPEAGLRRRDPAHRRSAGALPQEPDGSRGL